MFSVYIWYYKDSSGTIVDSSDPTTMFNVPMELTPGNDEKGFPVNNPVVVAAEDSSDSFDFTMDCDSPFYDALIQMKTRVRVDYDGNTIFFGRVLTVNTNTIYNTKNVHCEGAFSFMNDSFYEAVQEKFKKKISYNTYLTRLILNHNTQLATESWKYITRGTTTIDGSTSWTPTSEAKEFEPSSWTDTMSCVRNLSSDLGGHTRMRYYNGSLYLDWYKYYARDLGNGNRPVVRVTKNILDLSSESAVENIFTRVIPVGKADNSGQYIYVDGYRYTDKNGTSHTHSGKAMPITLLRDLYTDSQLNDEFHSAADYSNAETDYGIVYKTQSFNDAESKQELWNKAKAWMKECYYGVVPSFTVKAVDMHIVDNNQPKILLGDCVDTYYMIYENGVLTEKYKKLICKNARYDLFNPENNSYTLGIPSDLLKSSYSESKKKKA